MSKKSSPIEVAQIGRLVGLRGELKLHLHSDFPEQFKAGKTFITQKNITLEILSYNEKRGLVLFKGYESRDSASVLVNSFLLTSLEATLEDCELNNNELFWFDIIGCSVKENENVLGVVTEIERIGSTDYMIIKTDENLLKKNLSKTFYIPYIDRYVLEANKDEKVVVVKDGLELLENS
ncbi:ribosome maturation factor RimM [Sulfurospirillum arcachonense]|uniref:ribosome maturation factor RimM n=1 Tax=Sulfurospirillum arcachonense TaxID=57666 RepID=UPI00046AA825|nr:ribosome maturation factor RimM [Sulfurospirillum arcachonense]